MIMEQSDIIETLMTEAKVSSEGEITSSEIEELQNFIFFLPATAFESIHPPNLLCRLIKYIDVSIKHIDHKYSDINRLKKLEELLVACKNRIIKFASKSESYPNPKVHSLKAFHDLIPNKFANKNTTLLRLLSVLAIREFCCSPNYQFSHGFRLDYKNPIVGNLGERLKNISSHLNTTVFTDEHIRIMFRENAVELDPVKKLNKLDLNFFTTHVSSLVSKGFAKHRVTQDNPHERLVKNGLSVIPGSEINAKPIDKQKHIAKWKDPLEKINAL